MKKLLILMIMICMSIPSFSQAKSPKKTSQKSSFNVVLNQQVEILNARIDSMNIAHQQAIEIVKNEQKDQYYNYYNQLDSDLDRFLIYMSIFWTILGVILGIVIPNRLNNKSEGIVKENINNVKENVKNTVDDLKQHLQNSLQNNVRTQRDRNQLFSDTFSRQMEGKLDYINGKIREQTYYINGIKSEVKEYVQLSKINSLFSKAQNILKKSPREAIHIYTEILNIDSNHKEALLWRGIAYSNIEESEKALSDLRRLIRLEPRHARAFNNIANVYANVGQYKDALKNYNTALKINPQYAAVYSNIAILYTEQGKYQKALEYCDKALEIDDEIIKTHKQKISIYAKMAKSSENEEIKQNYLDKIKQEQVIVNMLKDRYLSELMSL